MRSLGTDLCFVVFTENELKLKMNPLVVLTCSQDSDLRLKVVGDSTVVNAPVFSVSSPLSTPFPLSTVTFFSTVQLRLGKKKKKGKKTPEN